MSETVPIHPDRGTALRRTLLLLLIALGFCSCLALLVWASGRGFGTALDAYYLILASDPYSCAFSLTGFGYLVHPFYALVGGDIEAFRILGIVGLASASLLFGYMVAVFVEDSARSTTLRYSIALSIAGTSFAQFASSWLTTPSYNSLNLSALLFFYAALIGGTLPSAPRNILSLFLISFAAASSLVVVALVKPTSAVIATITGIAWVYFLKIRRPTVVIVLTGTISLSLYLLAAILVDGGIDRFVDRNVLGIRLFALQVAPGGNLFAISRSLFGPFQRVEEWMMVKILVVGLAFCVVIFSVARGRSERGKEQLILISAVAFVGSAIVGLKFFRVSSIVWLPWIFWPLYALMLALLLAMAALLVVWLRGDADPVTQRYLRAAAILSMAPAAYAFGSGGAIILQAVHASVFLAASVLIFAFLAPMQHRDRVVFFCVSTFCVIVICLLLGAVGFSGPSNSTIWEQDRTLTVGPEHALLKVDAQTADYFKAAQDFSYRAGFRSGTPLLDISYQGPAMAFALGARSLATAWIDYEGYGRIAFSCAALRTVGLEELKAAWVVTGEKDTFETASKALRCAGLSFPSKYRHIVTVRRRGIGTSETIWKPISLSGGGG